MIEHCESFINLHYRSSLEPPTSVSKKWKMSEIPKSFNTDDYNKTELAKHIWVELCKMKDILIIN